MLFAHFYFSSSLLLCSYTVVFALLAFYWRFFAFRFIVCVPVRLVSLFVADVFVVVCVPFLVHVADLLFVSMPSMERYDLSPIL